MVSLDRTSLKPQRISMNSHIVIASLALGVMGALSTPMATAQVCDISDTKCAVNGGKCNIKFRNRTGDSGGSDGSTNLNQRSSAQTIVVKAKKANGNKAGNKLQIPAGTSKTMNIDKKANKDFQDIQISSQDNGFGVGKATMPCADVKAVLNGNGTCKVFNGSTNLQMQSFRSQLGFSCDGGAVLGPTYN